MGVLRLMRGWMVLLTGCLPMGCGSEEAANGPKEDGTIASGIRLTLQFPLSTDVSAIRFDFARVTCAGEAVEPTVVTRTAVLSDITLPGAIPGFVSPLDSPSEHVFADQLMVLPAGCYDVTTTPLAADGTPSQACFRARQDNVTVKDAFTTEVILINQCRNQEPRGAIDAVATLNQPPIIENLSFAKSKFGYVGASQTICATARDPNGDPIRFFWNDLPARLPFEGPVVISRATNPDGSEMECVSITPLRAGKYSFRLEVYDQMRDANGNLVDVESLLYDSLPRPSHDALTFSFYSAALRDDGQPCTAAADCASGVCKAYYPDEDGDGDGAQRSPGSMFCGSTPPPGFARFPTDCCDSDARAYSMQTASFTVPDNCGSFDYDCDGFPTPQPPIRCARCGGGPDTCSNRGTGWCEQIQDPTYGIVCHWLLPCEVVIPDCGATGIYVTSGGSCVPIMNGENFSECALQLSDSVWEARPVACH